jgi:hypothetical protein
MRDAAPDAVVSVRAGWWGNIGYDATGGRRRASFAWLWPQPRTLWAEAQVVDARSPGLDAGASASIVLLHKRK